MLSRDADGAVIALEGPVLNFRELPGRYSNTVNYDKRVPAVTQAAPPHLRPPPAQLPARDRPRRHRRRLRRNCN